MPILKTCRPCTKRGACKIKTDLLTVLRGTSIVGVITHSCGKRELPYTIGQAVWAEVNDAPWDEDNRTFRCWFPCHYLQVARVNTRAVVVITAGVMDGRSGKFAAHA